MLPKGGRVGVAVGLGVAVWEGVGVCSGVWVGDGVAVGIGVWEVQAVINPMIMMRLI